MPAPYHSKVGSHPGSPIEIPGSAAVGMRLEAVRRPTPRRAVSCYDAPRSGPLLAVRPSPGFGPEWKVL